MSVCESFPWRVARQVGAEEEEEEEKKEASCSTSSNKAKEDEQERCIKYNFSNFWRAWRNFKCTKIKI